MLLEQTKADGAVSVSVSVEMSWYNVSDEQLSAECEQRMDLS